MTTASPRMSGCLLDGNIYVSGEYLKTNPGWHLEEAPFKVEQIREMSRATQGVTLINLDEGTLLAGLEKLAETEAGVDNGEGEEGEALDAPEAGGEGAAE